MKSWPLKLAIVLLALSLVTYIADYLLFGDLRHIEIFLVGDLAFVFIEVLLVTVIIQQLLDRREKLNLLGKLNMVIGIFFSEVGVDLIDQFSRIDKRPKANDGGLIATTSWEDGDFRKAVKEARSLDYDLKLDPSSLIALKSFLLDKREFLLRLLENPNLLEHERFTDLLLAVFHFQDELDSRKELSDLPSSDLAHLTSDARRAYSRLVVEWIEYLRYLSRSYPYLYSLAVRMNPLSSRPDPIVRE